VTKGAELHTVWEEVGTVRVHGRVNSRAFERDANGRPHVVLVHGLGMATDYLEPTMRVLGETFAVSALDLPGFGGSRRVVPRSSGQEYESLHPTARASLNDLAEALIAWLRVRGIVAPILVGQSHGCQVVVEAVTRVPGLASGLVLNAPTMVAEHRGMLAQLWRVAMDTPREPLSLVPHVVRDYLRAGPLHILATLRDALRDRVEDKLPRVVVPVSIVTGARDPVSPPEWCERLARLTGSDGGASARFVVVPGAAHAVPFSHPEALAAEVVAVSGRVVAGREVR
jgi:pimeloyl-ACP methyl ester carboxylesterase